MHTIRTLLCLFVLSTALLAQSEVGGATLNGTVTDPTGAAVVNAKVTVTEKGTGFSRVAATNEAGMYAFVRIPVGTYDLAVEAPGFKPTRSTGITLAVGAVASFNIALEVGATSEQVTVTAEVPIVETTRSQAATAVNERAVRDLPINGRNFLDFTLLTPGVARDPRGGDLSFGGQRGTQNSLLVDGGDSNNLFFGQSSGRAGTRNPYTFSQDAVQEFQVNANGYNAEIGRAGAGVVNVVTKSGTNDLHGSAFWFFRDKAMNANTFINNSQRRPKQPYHFNQFGATLGGPVKRERLFYFLSYDAQRNTEPMAVFFAVAPPSDALSQQAAQELSKYLAPYTRGLDNNIGLAKVDWNASENDRLSVRYNIHRFTGRNFENAGNQSALERTGDSKVETDNIALNYTRLLGTRWVLDSRFIFLKDDEPGFANSSDPEAQIFQNNVLVMAIGRNNFSPRFTNTKRYQTIESLTWIAGRHTFKMGGDLNFERVANFFPGNFSGSFQFASFADFAARRQSQLTQAFAGPGTTGATTEPHINEYALFAQDTWRATDRLTLNYGIRYDLQDSADPLVANPDPGLAAIGIRTDRMNLDTNNVAARVGMAYRLTRGERLVLRAGYGGYYGRTPAIITGTAHSQNGIQVQTYTLRTGLPQYPQILPAPPAAARTPAIYVFASDYEQPLAHQWNGQLEFQLGRDYALTVGYLGVKGVRLTQTRDINLGTPEVVQATFADGSPAPYLRYPAARPNANFNRISLFDSHVDSIYHGGLVQLNKRFSRSFQVLTSYTFSKVIDTLPEQTSVVVGTGDDANVPQYTTFPKLERGRGNPDVAHRFILSGVWDIDYARNLANPVARALLHAYQLALIANVQSGRPYSAAVNTDINNDGNARTDRVPGLGRNTFDGPGFAGVDLRFSRDIPLYKERTRLRLMFEAFNLTNRANFSTPLRTQYNYNATTRVFSPNTTFGVKNLVLDPRILQVAARITF